MRRFSVSFLLISTIILSVTVLLGLNAFFVYSNTQQVKREDLQNSLSLQAEQLSGTLALPIWNVDNDQVNRIIESVMTDQKIYAVEVKMTSGDDQPILWSRDATWQAIIGQGDYSTESYLAIERPISHQDQQVGTIKMIATRRFIEKELKESLLQNLIVMAVTDAVLILSIYMLLYYIVIDPLKRIQRFAVASSRDSKESESISDGRFSRELYVLSDSIRTMVNTLKEQLSSIRTSERKVRGILDLSSGFIGLLTPEGEVLDSNRTSLDFAGIQLDEIIGKSFENTPWWTSSVEKQQCIREMMDKAMVGEAAKAEMTIRDQNGLDHVFVFNLKSVRDEAGNIVFLIPEAFDITKLKQSEQALLTLNEELESKVLARTGELSDMNSELEEEIQGRNAVEEELRLARDDAETANRAKSMFLANMSHEIRTPMNAVLGFAQLLKRDNTLSSDAQSKVDTIISSGDHLLAIINEILEISRIESGRVEAHPEAMDLHQLLMDMDAMFRPRAKEKNLAFELQYSEVMPRYILADNGKLRQIMTNLLGNALKFTDKGTVTLRAKQVGIDRFAIEVQDTGIGMATEEQEKLFLPFERSLRGEAIASGTGLGLAISRNYAKLMHGDITIESAIDKGSCFKVEFHAASTAVLPHSAERYRCVLSLAPDQGSISILVVDDEKTNRDLLRQLLEPIGFIVYEAANGHDAIKSMEVQQSEIIIMDLVMPGLNGIETTQMIRKSFPHASTMIIGLSASAFEDQKSDFFQADINAFLAKPFREKELFDILANFGGVRFVTEEADERTQPDLTDEWKPTLTNMPEAWQASFAQALSQGSISYTRQLAEEARGYDPALASYVLDKVSKYDLDVLKRLWK